jgi:hypothetical protein
MWEAMTSQFVIAGLDPAIHRTEEKSLISMDARVKPAHDESLILRSGIRPVPRRAGFWSVMTAARQTDH